MPLTEVKSVPENILASLHVASSFFKKIGFEDLSSLQDFLVTGQGMSIDIFWSCTLLIKNYTIMN